MRHNLKRKYSWKNRSFHFSMLNMAKRWNKKLIKECSFVGGLMWGQIQTNQMNAIALQSVTNQGQEVHTPGESALNGNSGTTIPDTIIHRISEEESKKLGLPIKPVPYKYQGTIIPPNETLP
jgi:hypothetical protein